MENNKLIKNLCIWGAVFTIFAGSALHFVYTWTNNNFIVGLFAPVNESVWEHMKLSFFPLMIFGIVEYIYLNGKIKNFFLGHFVCQITSIIFIIGFYYLYNLFLDESLILDILSFIVGVGLGKYLNYYILINKINFKGSEIFAKIILTILFIFFIYATLSPPKINLFLDSVTNTYGIYQTK